MSLSLTPKPRKARAPRKKAAAQTADDIDLEAIAAFALAPGKTVHCETPNCVRHNHCEVCGRKALRTKAAKVAKPGTPKQLAARAAGAARFAQDRELRNKAAAAGAGAAMR
jgi:hypothetical protein